MTSPSSLDASKPSVRASSPPSPLPRRLRRRRRRFFGRASSLSSCSSGARFVTSSSISSSEDCSKSTASTDTTFPFGSGTKRLANLNFSISYSGLIRVTIPSTRTAIPYRCSICAMCSRFWFIRKLATETGHFRRISRDRFRTPSSSI